MYEAKVLAHSKGREWKPWERDLFTIQATMPRFLLSELNTHRMFSRNSASSRAIPTEKLINKVLEEPFIPEQFNSYTKGMGLGEDLPPELNHKARSIWWDACRDAAKHARALTLLSEDGIDKSRANRLLEPFMWHTVIITATEWDNFFALRTPEGDVAELTFPAQIEFQKIGIMMREAMLESEPLILGHKGWHLPLVGDYEIQNTNLNKDITFWCMVSAGRCARVSYDTHENFEPIEKSYERAESLKKSGHMSPFEHQATPVTPHYEDGDYGGNLGQYWVQFRKLIYKESNLVGYNERRPHWYE